MIFGRRRRRRRRDAERKSERVNERESTTPTLEQSFYSSVTTMTVCSGAEWFNDGLSTASCTRPLRRLYQRYSRGLCRLLFSFSCLILHNIHSPFPLRIYSLRAHRFPNVCCDSFRVFSFIPSSRRRRRFLSNCSST